MLHYSSINTVTPTLIQPAFVYCKPFILNLNSWLPLTLLIMALNSPNQLRQGHLSLANFYPVIYSYHLFYNLQCHPALSCILVFPQRLKHKLCFLSFNFHNITLQARKSLRSFHPYFSLSLCKSLGLFMKEYRPYSFLFIPILLLLLHFHCLRHSSSPALPIYLLCSHSLTKSLHIVYFSSTCTER